MHSKTALWKKVATLQEKVEEMRGDSLRRNRKHIRGNGDMAVRQGYLWLERPETKTYRILMVQGMVGSWITACGS